MTIVKDGVTLAIGCDVSNVQGRALDCARAKQEGIDFLVAKATQGLTFNDRFFPANRAGARGVGLPFAAYHFLERGNGAGQAAHFVNYVTASGGFTGIGAACDVELQTEHPPVGPSLQDAKDFVAAFQRLLPGKPLVLYTGGWYWRGYLGNASELGDLPLWDSSYLTGSGAAVDIAQHGGSDGNGVTPGFFQAYGGWSRHAIRQYSSNATVAGVYPVDVNAAEGGIDAVLQVFGIGSTPPPPPPPPPSTHPFAQLTTDGVLGPATIDALQWWLHVSRDGVSGTQTTTALQQKVGALTDGQWGPNTTRALQTYLNAHATANITVDGALGPATISALQRFLNNQAGY